MEIRAPFTGMQMENGNNVPFLEIWAPERDGFRENPGMLSGSGHGISVPSWAEGERSGGQAFSLRFSGQRPVFRPLRSLYHGELGLSLKL